MLDGLWNVVDNLLPTFYLNLQILLLFDRVSPDRRPVLDVQEETSSFDDFSDWNSSFTGVNSEHVTDPAPVKISPILEFPEETEARPAAEPVTSSSPPPTQPDTLSSPVIPSYESFKNSPVSRIRNKKPSLGSNASFYDQPYSSVDELGTGFSSFTPPPPPDFRNYEPLSDDSPPTPDPPQEFSNKLYNAVHDQSEPELQPTSSGDFVEPGYAEPEVKTRDKPDTEVKGNVKSQPEDDGYAEPEGVSPPPPYFPSEYAGIENDGYDTDEELDKYLGEQEEKTFTEDPNAANTLHSSSPLSQGSAEAGNPEVMYAKPDLSKKKKNRKSPGNKSRDKDYDAAVVYDERTNL